MVRKDVTLLGSTHHPLRAKDFREVLFTPSNLIAGKVAGAARLPPMVVYRAG